MTGFTLRIEDRDDTELNDIQDLQAAIARLATPRGPTFIVISQTDHEYVQAGGCDGRYIVESRDFFGEGFLHWAAGYPQCNDRSETVVHYRNKCLRSEHPPRRCPLNTVVKRVLGHHDVREILLHYYATGSRLATYAWDDISAKYEKVSTPENDEAIQWIRPQRISRREEGHP